MNVEKLQEIVGQGWVITKREQMESYSVDETALAVRPKPADNVVVVKSANSKEVSDVLKLANREKTPVFIRGWRDRIMWRCYAYCGGHSSFYGKGWIRLRE